MSVFAAGAVLVALQAAAAGPAVLAGEAVKVDLGRRQLVVRTADPPHDTAFLVDEARTRIVAGGRPLALEQVRAGEWVLVAFEARGAQRRALLVRVGAARPARR